jgi:HEPN domain-containing protein
MNDPGDPWIAFAVQDLQMADLALREGIHNQVCFHSHQCVEKILKALLANLGKKPPRIHAIVDLLNLLPHTKLQEIREALEQMDIYYIPTRYPDALPGCSPDSYPDLEDAEEAIKTAQMVMEIWKGETS